MKNEIHFYEHNKIEVLFSHSSHTFPVHSHDAYCIGIVQDGNIAFTIAGKKKAMNPGDLFVIPSDYPVKIVTTSEYRYITICFKGRWKTELLKLQLKDYYAAADLCEFENACLKFAENDSLESAKFLVKTVKSMIKPIVQTRREAVEMSEQRKTAREICEYIQEHVNEAYRVDEIAEAIHLSKYYLERLFKREMGITPHQYYTQAKIREAKKKLYSSEKAVNIAADLGFSDQSHLSHSFYKLMGITPKDYEDNYHAR